MTRQNFVHYPDASRANVQLALLKVEALGFDKLYIFGSVDAYRYVRKDRQAHAAYGQPEDGFESSSNTGDAQTAVRVSDGKLRRESTTEPKWLDKRIGV